MLTSFHFTWFAMLGHIVPAIDVSPDVCPELSIPSAALNICCVVNTAYCICCPLP